MKLVVLGANGKTGRLVVARALQRGMDVTAVVRSPEKSVGLVHDRLRVVVADPCNKNALKQVLAGQDAVISTLGGRLPTKAATSIYYRSAEALVDTAWEAGLQRVIVTSTALLFPDQTVFGSVLRFLVPNVVRSAARMEAILATSALAWTVVRPGFLTDDDEAVYRAQRDSMPENGTAVSRRALAAFLVDALEDRSSERAAFGVANAVTQSNSVHRPATP